MGKRKTHEEFVREANEIRGDNYEFLSLFKSSKEKIKLKHKTCGFLWETLPGNLTKKNQKGKLYCPQCNGGVKTFNTESFKSYISDMTNSEYIILGKYVNAGTPVAICHNVSGCKHKYKVRPTDFINFNNRCPKCSNNIMKTTEDFKKEVYSLVEDEYIVVGDYINSKTSVKLKHNVPNCNEHFYIRPTKFLYNGQRCKVCYYNSKVRAGNFHEKLKSKYGNEYIVLDQPQASHVKIRILHNIESCQTVFYRTLTHFLNDERLCPCTQKVRGKSKGELMIHDLLKNRDILFKEQFSIEECRMAYPLRFDFAILNSSKDVVFVLEYDGEHHFEPVDYAGKGMEFAEEKLRITQERDKIKNEFCSKNDIPLLRIPYWEFNNVEQILDKYMENVTLN